jgi:hypothetical protein
MLWIFNSYCDTVSEYTIFLQKYEKKRIQSSKCMLVVLWNGKRG